VEVVARTERPELRGNILALLAVELGARVAQISQTPLRHGELVA